MKFIQMSISLFCFSMMSQSSTTQQKHSDVPIPRMTGHMKEAPPAQESPPDKEPPTDDENTTKIADNDTDLQAQVRQLFQYVCCICKLGWW